MNSDLIEKGNVEFLTLEMKAQLEKIRITSNDQLPNIYRKAAKREEQNAKEARFLHISTVPDQNIEMIKPVNKKGYRYFRKPKTDK